jgi:hypothetical protein
MWKEMETGKFLQNEKKSHIKTLYIMAGIADTGRSSPVPVGAKMPEAADFSG